MKNEVMAFIKGNEGQSTLKLHENLADWLEYKIINAHFKESNENFLITEIKLAEILKELLKILKPTTIILIMAIYSFNFKFSKYNEKKKTSSFKLPDLNIFNLFIYLYEYNSKDNKLVYLHDINKHFYDTYGYETDFNTFEEIFHSVIIENTRYNTKYITSLF